jgi:hypothetical protein
MAWLMVRAVVREATDRPRFDRWYETEHLPDAVRAFGVARAWRCWSAIDPTVHYAFYEFPDLARAREVVEGPAIRPMIAEFDRVWGDRVTRSRELMGLAGEIGAATH